MSAYNSTPAFAIGGVQPANQWRSVKDEMPKDWDTVIVIGMASGADEPAMYSGYWDGEQWLTDPTYDQISEVTHWMPMPTAPGKEAA